MNNSNSSNQSLLAFNAKFALLLPIFALFVTAANSTVADECIIRLGAANSDIARFGGLSPRTPIQDMANLMLSYVPRGTETEVQIGIPIFLESSIHNDDAFTKEFGFGQTSDGQFGDKQRNALATYGPFKTSPFIAVLSRNASLSKPSELAMILGKDLPGREHINAIEVSVMGNVQTLPIDADGAVRIPVDLQQLNWNQMYGAKSVYFRPVGWTDWFTIQFPYAYVSVDELVGGMDPAMQKLPNGQSIINPLGLSSSVNIQNDLRKVPDANNPGFAIVRTERSTGVHGTYVLDDGKTKVQTATGGVWTRYRLGDPFKIVYLAKDERVVDIEEENGIVSGTGPHFIGATGEIIVNSLEKEGLMTFYGAPSPTTVPGGGKLAWGFTHQWIGTWLKPGQAFVTPQGLFHWHLNHLNRPIAAQVFTPPMVPSEQNHFGFPGAKK